MIHRYSSHLGLLILLVGNAVWLGSAQVPFPGKCPEVKVMDTFDVESYTGVWYEYSKYPFAFEIGKKCIYADYEIIDNSTISVVNVGINRLTGQASNVTGKAKVIAPAQLAVAFFPNQPTNTANYLVLGTDYESYAVVYSCTGVSTLVNFKIVWILTRERQPSAATIATAKKILENNSISQTFLIDTIQTGCPNVGNATASGADDELDLDDFVTTVVPNAIERA
ncbi:hypothetical protein KR018_007561 [Drosophila ironensis]|nr:hypothetical protein KR018_007561 [Drosophila ironensis]